MDHRCRGSWRLVALLLLTTALLAVGCASVRLPGSADVSRSPTEEPPVLVSADTDGAADGIQEEYDPWQPFNEGIFAFNRQVDRFVLKPVATVWDKVLPDEVQRSLKRAFDNLGMPRRVVNNLLQGKGERAVTEVGRFAVNTILGVAGLFDVAKSAFGLPASDEDAGQTFGVWGIGPGPYLVLPFVPPLTVRDGVGWAVDLALDPLNYVLPFAALAGMTAGRIVNERSLTLQLYQDVEETVLDLYSAVRNAYLQRRERQIKE